MMSNFIPCLQEMKLDINQDACLRERKSMHEVIDECRGNKRGMQDSSVQLRGLHIGMSII